MDDEREEVDQSPALLTSRHLHRRVALVHRGQEHKDEPCRRAPLTPNVARLREAIEAHHGRREECHVGDEQLEGLFLRLGREVSRQPVIRRRRQRWRVLALAGRADNVERPLLHPCWQRAAADEVRCDRLSDLGDRRARRV